MINERRTAILNIIVEQYIKTGEPIGSKTLCLLLPYSVSSATIRNEMAYLTELGFLEQRHTSGGRVPTRLAYRYYVDNLMQEKEINDYNKNLIFESLSVNAGDPERLLADAAKLISRYTNCAGFCCMLDDSLDCIQGVDLIPAGNNKAMLVMLTLGSKIKSSLVNLPCRLDDEFRYIFHEVINRLFVGKPLIQVNTALVQSSLLIARHRTFDLLPVLTSLCALCKEASQSKLTIEGETNLLSHDELGGDIYKLLSVLADKKKIISMIKDFTSSSTKSAMLIGEENPLYDIKNTTTVLSKFTYGNNQQAVLGMLGSTRIDYPAVLAYVKYIISVVDNILEVQNGERKEKA